MKPKKRGSSLSFALFEKALLVSVQRARHPQTKLKLPPHRLFSLISMSMRFPKAIKSYNGIQ